MPFNKKNIRGSIQLVVAVSILSIFPTSCFTGIESTPKIGSSEVKHRNAANATKEQLLLEGIKPEHFGEWKIGKQFIVTDSKISVIFSTSSIPVVFNRGDAINYTGAEKVISPVGEAVDIYFETADGKGPLIYRVNASLSELKERSAVEIPFAVERVLPDEVREQLIGQTFYITTPRWYDTGDNIVTRVKYIPVKIIDVQPGSNEFPVKLLFKPVYKTFGEKDVYSQYITIGNTSRSSRNFETMFSIGNPRERYPAITDENWSLIIENKITPGMTREEARLALGSPNDVDRGHDYSSTYERWIYDGGVYLIFRDGVLETFRR